MMRVRQRTTSVRVAPTQQACCDRGSFKFETEHVGAVEINSVMQRKWPFARPMSRTCGRRKLGSAHVNDSLSVDHHFLVN